MFRMLHWIGIGLAVLLVSVAVSVIGIIRLSVSSEEGFHIVSGVMSPVEIDFDGHGIPSIRAKSRTDAFEALGYVTARDRLFQMDLFRRRTAGRLAEIFGATFIPSDTWNRIMGFERLATAILDQLPQEQRVVLTSYSAGVNRVLEETRTLPVEFTALGYRPEAWRPEDSVLIILGMAGLSYGEYEERMASVMRQALPANVVEFLTPENDCYNEILAPRNPARCTADAVPVEDLEKLLLEAKGKRYSGLVGARDLAQGSNAWVVAPEKTRNRRAIIANDMHLALTVPNIWYRAQLNYGSVRLAGLTMPGVPMLIAGSNGEVAWGFTNLRADVTDLVRLESDPMDSTKYRTPEGSRTFMVRTESIAVRGAPVEKVQVRETIWGPVLHKRLLGDEVAVHWTALDPLATNFDILDMDQVTTTQAALLLFHHAGATPLNALVADRSGNIAWTVLGKLPKRFGMDGLFSESWADGKFGWQGYLSPDEIPSLVNPRSGFLVNTNQRMLGRAEFEPAIGHDFAGGFRAWRVTERLRDLSGLAEGDMLSLQLDTTSEFYRYYQVLALQVLKTPGGDENSVSAILRRYLEAWDGRAEVDSLGLPLIVEFRKALIDAILSPIVARCREVDPAFEFGWSGIDGPIQHIIESGRPELLPDRKSYPDWPSFIRSTLETSAQRLAEKYGMGSIDGLTWGKVNTVEMTHSLSGGLPFIGRFLDMPRQPLAGCVECVRYAYRNNGANSRMVVAPGHEVDGILEMAGGQSGQLSSIHYADQEESWVAGLPTPFLAGEQKHSMILKPPGSE